MRTLEGMECFVFERYPAYKNSGYTRQVVWLDKKEYRMLKIDFYDRKNASAENPDLSRVPAVSGEILVPGRNVHAKPPDR